MQWNYVVAARLLSRTQRTGRLAEISQRVPRLVRTGVLHRRQWRDRRCAACRATAHIQPMNADAIRASPLAANPAPMPMERQRAASRVGRWVWCKDWKTARREWRATL